MGEIDFLLSAFTKEALDLVTASSERGRLLLRSRWRGFSCINRLRRCRLCPRGCFEEDQSLRVTGLKRKDIVRPITHQRPIASRDRGIGFVKKRLYPSSDPLVCHMRYSLPLLLGYGANEPGILLKEMPAGNTLGLACASGDCRMPSQSRFLRVAPCSVRRSQAHSRSYLVWAPLLVRVRCPRDVAPRILGQF